MTVADDKLEIIEVCIRAHWLYDHDAWDDVDITFTETVAMPTVAQAVEPGFDPYHYLDAYRVARDKVRSGLSGFKVGLITQHLVAGHHVVLDGDTAVCRAHAINVHLATDAPAGAAPLLHGNEYRFDLVRTPAGWRIRGWIPTVLWSWGEPHGHDLAAKQQAWIETA